MILFKFKPKLPVFNLPLFEHSDLQNGPNKYFQNGSKSKWQLKYGQSHTRPLNFFNLLHSRKETESYD